MKYLLALLAASMGSACLAQTAPVDAISPDFLPAPALFGQGPRLTPERMPPVTCFAEGTDPQIVAAVNQALARYLDNNFVNGPVQWGSQGQPITITWSLAPDGLSIPGDPNVGDATSPNNLFSTMDSKFGGIANRATWVAQLQACFDRWALLTGITFNRVSIAGQAWDDGGAWGTASSAFRGTIRVAMHNIDGPNGILGFCYFPSNANGSGGDMVLDSSENWGNSANSYRFLRNTIGHEMGHGLGLMHVCPTNQTKLMEPFLSLSYDGPQHDDVRGMQYLYGDGFEPNNTAVTATLVAPTISNTQIEPSYAPGDYVPGVFMTSLNSGDEDWFKSTVTTAVMADFIAEPLGMTYDSSTQNANGTCNSGNTINSENLASLAMQVLAADGTTVWASGTSPAGYSEDIYNVLLSPGTYYVRVYATNSFPGSQVYWYSYIGRQYPHIYATDGDFNTKVRVSWDAIPNATETAIYRGTSPTRAQATLIELLGQGVTSWDDTSVAQGITYYYWMETQQSGGGGLRPATDYNTGYAGAAPANNTCANAYVIGEGDFYGSTSYATNDGSAACGNSNSSKDVWYHFIAPADGTVRFSTCGTNDMNGQDTGMDTVLSLHSACPGTSANTLICSDDASGPINCVGSDIGAIRDSALTYNLARNQEFLVRVAGYNGSSGEFVLHVNYLPPSNDLCSSAFPATNGATPFSNAGAGTDGPNEPGCGGSYTQIGRDVWFRYTATCTGNATASLCGSDFDSKIAAYHGTCPLVPGTVIACNDDGVCILNAQITFPVLSGQDYLIRCGGYYGQNGNGTLTMSCVSTCGSTDFNCDGDVGTDADIEAFFACIAGNCPGAPCTSTADFNADGDVGTDADIEAFFRVLAGGNC